MCDKGNEVEFNSKICTITNLDTDEVVLKGKRQINVYKISIMSLPQSEHTCLSVVEDDPLLWHKKLRHASLSQLNKLAAKDLFLGLPKVEFSSNKVCEACVRGKHVKSPFKSKKVVSAFKPLELLLMDLCGPIRVRSRGGTRYVFVIVDDFSKYTWTLFLGSKDETFEFSSDEFSSDKIRPWKHQRSHPLENIISDQNAGVQTRSSLRNLRALTTFLSRVEPKTIKEDLKDLDWIIAMQEELNQSERSKV
ncbi:PREDICTED: uncharacterized protein LOC109208237 [Nicotiana attenuata]|uniref:uncharacterized protein LOC109208237 n=1 Tax=Nicotiana attenuata TaxID=49451 RepID=UPI000905BF75|nr:PREDICTED: uncharacterized protein LOC109208237 [Nicotiana attenuata]